MAGLFSAISQRTSLVDSSSAQASTKVETDSSDKGGFLEKLQQFFSGDDSDSESLLTQAADAASSDDESGIDVDTGDIITGVAGVGLGLASGNVLSAGLAGTELLQATFQSQIQEEFTELGQELAVALIAGLSGDPSATAVASASSDTSLQQSLLTKASAVGDSANQAVSDTAAAASDELDASTQALKTKIAAAQASAANSDTAKTVGTIPQALLNARAAEAELLDPSAKQDS